MSNFRGDLWLSRERTKSSASPTCCCWLVFLLPSSFPWETGFCGWKGLEVKWIPLYWSSWKKTTYSGFTCIRRVVRSCDIVNIRTNMPTHHIVLSWSNDNIPSSRDLMATPPKSRDLLSLRLLAYCGTIYFVEMAMWKFSCRFVYEGREEKREGRKEGGRKRGREE